MKSLSLAASTVVLLNLSACGPMQLGGGEGYEPPLKEEYRAADKVQAIVRGQDNPSDTSLRGQYHYTIGPDRRLLVSYTFAGDLIQRAETRRGKMILRVAVDLAQSQGKALEDLQLTPLLRAWVLGSTWSRYNGFIARNSKSEWTVPGGDLDWVGAGKGSRKKPLPLVTRRPSTGSGATTTTTSSSTTTTQPEVFEYVYFDITDWFLNYIKGRGANYGFALTSSKENILIFGEQSGTLGPVIIWYEEM